MAQVGVENAVEICRDYLLNLGIENTQLDNILQSNLFEDGFVQLLTDAVVINANKSPNTTAKTTHIHVTGPSRFLFYSEEELRTVGGLGDEIINVELLNVNLAHLSFLGVERGLIPFSFEDSLELISTYTVKKISTRGGQVQISKLSLDGPDFIDFRRGLYPDDLLVFLKYVDRQDGYLAIGIPAMQNPDLIENQRLRLLSATQAKTIGAYSINQDRDREIVSEVDLTEATERRLNRSMRHQTLLRNIANRLESTGYNLYEGMIDCLAEKPQSDVLIFEMKTLDGTATDEMNQVRDALGQLLYYDFLQSGQFTNATKYKIACFEREISEQHQQLLLHNDCYVIWLDHQGRITGNQESIAFLRSLNIL